MCMLIEYEIESCLGLCLVHNNGGQGQENIKASLDVRTCSYITRTLTSQRFL